MKKHGLIGRMAVAAPNGVNSCCLGQLFKGSPTTLGGRFSCPICGIEKEVVRGTEVREEVRGERIEKSSDGFQLFGLFFDTRFFPSAKRVEEIVKNMGHTPHAISEDEWCVGVSLRDPRSTGSETRLAALRQGVVGLYAIPE